MAIDLEAFRNSRRNMPREYGQPVTTETGLASVSLGATPGAYRGNPTDIGQVATQREGQSLDLLRGGLAEALRLSDLGRQSSTGMLEPFVDTQAFGERNALLGLYGSQAQEEAIGGIPVSEFDKELQRRQLEQQARSAAATGDLGGGAFIADRASLASQQQAQTIQNRLSQLSPLIQLSQGAASQLSGLDENALTRMANLAYGSGIDMSNVQLGAAQGKIQGIQTQAEIEALKREMEANRKSGLLSGALGLAGSLIKKV